MDTRSHEGRRYLTGLLCMIGITLLLLWRRPDMIANPQLWAEDGNVFFMQGRSHGLSAFLLPYSGYYHLAQRFVAWVGSALPVQHVPHWYSFASWLLLLLLTIGIFSRRIALPIHQKVVMSVVLVATTVSNEVFLNLANWATLAAVGSILLAIREEPRTRADAVVDISLLLVCSLSTPYSICLWVPFLARWVFRRTSHSAWLLVIAFAAGVLQVSNMEGRISTPAVGSLTERVDVILYRFGFIFLGEEVYQLAFSGALGMLGLIGCAGLYGAIAWRAVKDRNRTAVLILIGGGVVAAVSLFVTRSWAPVDVKFHAGRHQYIPSVTLIWALACLERSRLRWVPIGMAFAAFVWLTPANKREVLPDLRWAESVSGCLEQPDPCLVPINPAGVPQMWYVTIVRKP